MPRRDPLDRLVAGLEVALALAEAEAHLCPDCGAPMTKAGWGYSGRQRRQLWWCKGCHRRTMREKKGDK